MRSDDFKTDHLRPHEQLIAKAVLSVLPKDADGGGGTAFYSPDEWAKRGEQYGTNSLLVIVHDGGDLAPFCNLDYCNSRCVERLAARLQKMGLFVEQCTSWYSAVYLA